MHHRSHMWLAIGLALALSVTNSWAENTDEKAVAPPLFPYRDAGQWGYINDKGEVVVQPQFSHAGDFSEGLAYVAKRLGGTRGYIDETGAMAFEIPDDWGVRDFSDGLAVFRISDKFGYFDRQGKIVVEAKYDDAKNFSEGLAAVNVGAVSEGFPRPFLREGGKWGFIDKRGNVVIPIEWKDVDYRGFRAGLAQVTVNDRFGFIDKKGKVAFTLENQWNDPKRWIASVGVFSEGLANVRTSGYDGPYSGFIDKSGKFAIQPKFDGARDFSEGLAIVTAGKKSGYADRTGQIVIEPQFDDAKDFHEGLAAVQKGQGWSYIDKRGQIVVAGPFNDTESFHGGLARVHEGGEFVITNDGPAYWTGGEWFYINAKGQKVRRCCRDEESPGYGNEFR